VPPWLPALLALALGAGDPEGNFIVPGTRGAIVYRRVDGQELRLDAYLQRRGTHRPAVVVIHGGNWTSGSRIAFVGQLLETLTRAGYNWLSVDYRLGGPDRRADALDDAGRALIRRYSPIHHVTKEMPPLLLIHGTKEGLWAQGVAMRDRLRDVGARHELVALEGAPHGMENWEGHPEWAGYKTRLVEWLSRQLGARP